MMLKGNVHTYRIKYWECDEVLCNKLVLCVEDTDTAVSV